MSCITINKNSAKKNDMSSDHSCSIQLSHHCFRIQQIEPMEPIIPPPSNGLVSPLLTDLYQITMAYAYWRTGRHMDHAVFELFFRKNPFGGEYTVFAGLDEVLKFLVNFRFTQSDLDYLKSVPALRNCDPMFFDEYLANLDCSEITVQSMKQGTVAFPRIPLLIISGPLGITQLLETTLLTLINYPSLLTTNAVRMVVAATSPLGNSHYTSTNPEPKVPRCVEFGLRRAQGPDGGFSASKYAILGGFVATSNVLAGKLLNVPISGTHAHAFVQSHSSLDQVANLKLPKIGGGGEQVSLLPIVTKYREELGHEWKRTNEGELAAFIAYAVAFPDSFLCLIDTYDTINSGLKNFILVSLALSECGYQPRGIRLDSGDLSYLSIECEKMFHDIAAKFDRPFFRNIDIVASNDINEDVLHSLNKQGHAVTVFGIGTNLVTCQKQPALGCVYKLVELNGQPRMKLSQDLEKVLIPGRKRAYRLYGVAGWPLLDLMIESDEAEPKAGQRTLCRHPFIEQKRVAVIPSYVENLHSTVFEKGKGATVGLPTLNESAMYVSNQIKCLRPDILRAVNPGQYKVSVSIQLFDFLHGLWQVESPVVEIS